MSWLTWLVVAGFALLFGPLLYNTAPGLALVVLAAIGGYLALRGLRSRHDARDPAWRLPRCHECGVALAEGAAVCPLCGGVMIERLGRVPRAGAAERATARRAAAADRSPPPVGHDLPF